MSIAARVDGLIARIKEAFRREKKQLCFCLVISLVWGLIAHAYGFLNGNFSHDSLNGFYAGQTEEIWKVELGRFFVPIYRAIFRGPLCTPWLIGLVSLVYIGLSVYFVAKIFNINSKWLIVLVSGIMVTNITVTALTATYLYELDFDMLALLLATISAYVWKKQRKSIKFYGGGVLLALSIGIYQSYMAVTLTLILATLIFELINGKSTKKVLLDGLSGVAVILCGCILYYVVNIAICTATGIQMQDRTNPLMFTNIKAYIIAAIEAYMLYFDNLINRLIYPQCLIYIVVVGIFMVVLFVASYVMLRSKNINKTNKFLFLFLLITFPFGTNIIYFIARRFLHTLMVYAIWLSYIFVLMLALWYSGQKGIRRIWRRSIKLVSIIVVGIIIMQNIILSNTAYLKKDIEQEATLSVMTRVVAKMEEQDEYVAGETEVAFIGTSKLYVEVPGFEHVKQITGLEGNSSITYFKTYEGYLKYIMKYAINFCDHEKWNELIDNEYVKQMPSFPYDGCIQMVDGVMVVKMGD